MIHPNTVERTIIIIEKTNEFTDISVARCLDGIVSLSRISVRTSRKSSEKDPINPPKTIRGRQSGKAHKKGEKYTDRAKQQNRAVAVFVKVCRHPRSQCRAESHHEEGRSKQRAVHAGEWQLRL